MELNVSAGHRIVLGIDESEAAEDPALEWALSEAAATRRGVDIVHAVGLTPRSVTARLYGAAHGDVAARDRTHAQAMLDAAVRRAENAYPGVLVSTRIADIDPGRALVELSDGADLIVVGSRHLGSAGSIVLGSVGNAVAARANCPVVVVRGPGGSPAEGAAVVVGIDGNDESEPALAFAFGYAAAHGLALHAVLAWPPDRLAEMRWRPVPPAPVRASALLSEVMAGWRDTYPDVPVVTGVVRAHPVAGLVAAAHGNALLVVGRGSTLDRFGVLLGSVAIGVVHHATCPVAVVPPGPKSV